MRVLAFDTALGAGSVAVVADGSCLARRDEPRPRALAERLLPMIEETLAEAGLGYGDLDLIAVTVGPGTFAGLRIGVAAARGLSLATGVPAAGVTSLEALAFAALPDLGEGETVVAAVDGRRGQLYRQAFEKRGGALAALEEPAAVEVAEAGRGLPSGPGRIVGSGAGVAARTAPAGLHPVPASEAVDAEVVARCAASRPVPAAPPRPLYLRAPDAKLPGGAAAG